METRNIWRKASCYLLYFDGKAWSASQLPSWGKEKLDLNTFHPWLATQDHQHAVPGGEGPFPGTHPLPGPEDPTWPQEAPLVPQGGQHGLHLGVSSPCQQGQDVGSFPGTRMSCETKIKNEG